MSNYNIGYLRVSTLDQNTDRQLSSIGVELDKTYIDKCSGGSRKRPKLDEMIQGLRKGDTIHVHSIDRLARNLSDLQELVATIIDVGATLRFHKEQLTFSPEENGAMSRLLLQVMGAFAEFEKALIRERQAEGIAEAKAKGVYKGRKTKYSPGQLKKTLDKHNGNKTAAARELGISYRTMLRAFPKV